MRRKSTPTEKRIKKLKSQLLEYEHLFSIQSSRLAEATKFWREETGKHDCSPDLGELLEFLMDRIRVEEPPKILVGYTRNPIDMD